MADDNNNNNINNNDDNDDDEVVTLSVTPSKGVDVDFNNTGGDEGGSGGGGGGSVGVKAARLPRWTRQEILVLIQGKRVAENRVRRGRNAAFCDGNEGHQQQQQTVVEPKWATVSSYCKRHGVNRGPVQCRKRWSNLAGDFKKIKEWESLVKDESDSFWLMRNDLRREKKLPGFFDKEVFDILNNNNNNTVTCTGSGSVPPDSSVEPLFDSGRIAAADDGLFSDFEPAHHQQQRQTRQQHEQQEDEIMMGDNDNQVEVEIKVETQSQHHLDPPTLLSSPNLTSTSTIPAPTPISEKQYQPKDAEVTPPGTGNEKQREGLNLEIGSTSREGRKRRRFIEEDDNNNNNGEQQHQQDELCQVLEKNGRILSAQLDAYNINLKLDREERKDNANSLVAVLNKLADSLGRIADKL